MGGYLVQRCLAQEHLRDEVLCMIVNQTWLNPNDINCERGWVLMALCLSCFSPSDKLYPYLLCHVTAHAYETYKPYCQAKLLQAYGREARLHAPCQMEWQAAASCAPMAINVGMCVSPSLSLALYSILL